MATCGRNNRLWRIAGLAGLLLACSAGICRADDAADAKLAAVGFVQALAKMDAPGARTFLSDTAAAGDEGKFVDIMTSAIIARRKFLQAAAAKFGPQPENTPANDPINKMVEKIEHSNVSFVDGVAIVGLPHDPSPLTLRKIGSVWKVIGVAPAEKLHEELPRLAALANAQETTAQEINDGKYQSLAEAKQAIRQKMAAATTIPASARLNK